MLYMCPQVRVEVHGVGAATECIRGDVWNQTLSVLMVGKVTTATVTVLDQYGLVQVAIYVSSIYAAPLSYSSMRPSATCV
jgi:hypothetical protein